MKIEDVSTLSAMAMHYHHALVAAVHATAIAFDEDDSDGKAALSAAVILLSKLTCATKTPPAAILATMVRQLATDTQTDQLWLFSETARTLAGIEEAQGAKGRE